MTIKIDGLAELQKNLAAIESQIEREIAKAKIGAGKLVEGEARRSIQTRSDSGRTVKVRGGVHTISKEGDAPNTDTGTLQRSLQTEIKGSDVYVGTANDYAPHLEYGTKKMKPRPFLLPALRAKSSDILELLKGAVKKGLPDDA